MGMVVFLTKAVLSTELSSLLSTPMIGYLAVHLLESEV